MPEPVLMLDDEHARSRLDMASAIAPIRASCLHLDDLPEHRVRNVFDHRATNAHGLLVGGYFADQRVVCVKLVGDFAGGSGGFTALYDTERAALRSVYSGHYLTDFRTGAVSGVATDALAREDSSVLAMIGTGRQAVTQFAAVCAVRRIRTVRVWNRTPERARRWVEERLRERPGAPIEFTLADTPEQACRAADIVVTATAANAPVVEDIAWLAPGTHVNAVGAGSPAQRELGATVLRDAHVVVLDAVADALRVGDFDPLRAEPAGSAWPIASLATVLEGGHPGRLDPADITVFKSVGHPANDAAALALLTALVTGDRQGADA